MSAQANSNSIESFFFSLAVLLDSYDEGTVRCPGNIRNVGIKPQAATQSELLCEGFEVVKK